MGQWGRKRGRTTLVGLRVWVGLGSDVVAVIWVDGDFVFNRRNGKVKTRFW